MRLDKFLAENGLGTRTEVKKLIRAGRITINEQTTTRPEQKIAENTDVVCLDGNEIVYEKYHYILLYKPAGCVTALTDNLHQTVMELLPEEFRSIRNLSPVGRLDLDTEGILLLTDDGALNHHLMSPAHHVAKTYYARLDREVPETAIAAFLEGISIGDDKPTLPAELTICPAEQGQESAAFLTLTEGRYHQVKRMFHAVGCEVVYLRRERLGTLTLDGMKPGECRRLTPEELASLRPK